MAHGPMPTASSGPVVHETYRTGRVARLASVAALGGFLFGFDSAVINGASEAIKERFELGPFMLGFAVAIALLGSAIGAWFAGALADRFGRKRVMVIAAALFMVSAVGTALPFAVWDLMFWRLVGGAGIGIASVIAPMYIAEIAPAQMRGRLGSLQQLAIVLGIFATGITNYIIIQLADGSASNELWWGLDAWQWMFLIMLVPAAVYGYLASRIPESPRYLVSVGREAEALEVLESVFTSDQHPKLAVIEESLSGDRQPRFAALRGNRFGLLPIVWVGIILSVLQQFVGINAVFYFSNSIWQAVGFSEDSAFLTSAITNTVNVATTLVAIALIDKVGRRPLLIVGSVGMTVMLLTLTIAFGSSVGADGEPNLIGATKWVALIAFNLYVVFFGMSWGPVVWVLLGEMFPNSIRAAALAIAAAAQWLANFLVTTTFPSLSSASLALAYGIFTAFALLSIFFVVTKIKETKGRELESMTLAG